MMAELEITPALTDVRFLTMPAQGVSQEVGRRCRECAGRRRKGSRRDFRGGALCFAMADELLALAANSGRLRPESPGAGDAVVQPAEPIPSPLFRLKQFGEGPATFAPGLAAGNETAPGV
jgi:hypothetical protein